VSAFLLGEADVTSPKPHLSVNSSSIQSVDEIVTYYRVTRQSGDGDVAYCGHTVARYVQLGRRVGAQLAKQEEWEFLEADVSVAAFKHRPVRTPSPATTCPSHCGVEFIRSLDALAQSNLARELAKYPRFRVHSFP
jgi:hypothetical protein